MKDINKPFVRLTADDVMSRPVERIPQNMPIAKAASILSRGQISGAPVVDEAGCCVGILAATDFVHWAENCGPAGVANGGKCTSMGTHGQVVKTEIHPEDEVAWFMTPDPVTAAPSTPIRELAQMMLDAHIHRVIVVDEDRRPIGIVTSTDILAVVARLDEEAIWVGLGCVHGLGRG
jgi:CBS-domain-containing membrane protein